MDLSRFHFLTEDDRDILQGISDELAGHTCSPESLEAIEKFARHETRELLRQLDRIIKLSNQFVDLKCHRNVLVSGRLFSWLVTELTSRGVSVVHLI